MVFHPLFPILDLLQLIDGVLMIILAFFAIKKVRDGSKNTFAYVILSFTVLLGISYLGESLNDTFRKAVV